MSETFQQKTEPARRNSKLFRPEVYKKFGMSHEGSVAKIQLPGLGVITWVALGILASIIALLYFGQYARRETVSGIVTNGLGPIKVYAPTVGMVINRLVDEGAEVKVGDPLFVISTDKSTSDIKSTQDVIKKEIVLRQGTLRADLLRMNHLKDIEERNLRQSLAAGESQDRQITREIEIAGARVRTAQLNMERYQTLAKEKYVVDSYLIDKEQDLQNQNIQYEALIRQRDGIRKDNESLRNQMAGFATKKQMENAEVARSLGELNQQIMDADSRKEQVVTAQSAGRVSGLTVDKGSTVTNSSVLLSIQSTSEVKDVQLFVPSRAIGFIKIGTKVKVRFDAFPYQKFGQYSGVISKISTQSVPKQEIPFAIKGSDDYFRIFITMETPYILAYGEKINMKNGFIVEADMILDERKIYEWIIEPILGFTIKQ
ncbi:MAG: hypothetical protein RLZZ535_2759 [Cyanobacteriota bacterium]|jgi:membrane fusion protein